MSCLDAPHVQFLLCQIGANDSVHVVLHRTRFTTETGVSQLKRQTKRLRPWTYWLQEPQPSGLSISHPQHHGTFALLCR
jgi:hypothetical protein